MRYAAELLGVDMQTKPWKRADELPAIISRAYDFNEVTICGVRCLSIRPVGEIAALPTLKKHITNITKAANIPVVAELGGISARQRKALIAEQIPFVVDNTQVYLPFLGISLQERYAAQRTVSEKLTPFTQLFFLQFVYSSEAEVRTSDAGKALGASPMQVTRAVRQLQTLGLVTVTSDGVFKSISSDFDKAELFAKAKPHLISPVRRRIYVDKADLPAGLPLAGESALSEFTMLNPPNVEVRAYFGKVGDLRGTDVLVDGDTQAEVEIWLYDPEKLTQTRGMADTLSLFLSLAAADDVRLETERDELLARIWGNNGCTTR